MTGRYKEYPEYKNSGIEWLKEMPAHWDLVKAKHIFKKVQRAVRPEDGIVTAFRDGEVTLRSNRRTDGFTNAAKEIGYQGVRRGDLLVHAMDGFAGAIGISDSNGKCSPVCSVCIPWYQNLINTNYYGYLVRQLAVTDYITSLAKGIRERSTEFRFNEFSGLFLAVPPKVEQQKIASFLDHETAKIDTLITKQEKLIELLKEKRQAVISHAVTKGINPDATMKDSGVEWLGEVPEHWSVGRYKFCTNRIIVGIAEAATHAYADNGIPLIRSTNIKDNAELSGNFLFLKPEFAASNSSKYLFQNDVVTVRTGYPGVSAVVPKYLDRSHCFTNLVATPNKDNQPYFLAYYLNSHISKAYFDLQGWGSAQQNISVPILENTPIAYPPKDEQVGICSYIKKQREHFNKLTSNAMRSIELMKERKTALISAAVTGKIDVRE